MKVLSLLVLTFICSTVFGQSNIHCTSKMAQNVMKGLFDPNEYKASNIQSDHNEIICGLGHGVRADSIKSYLEQLETFDTRHTYSDTLSNTKGIGAARRWAYAKFKEIGASNEGRLIPSYLQFDYLDGACGPGFGWKNVLAVLPGMDTSEHEIVLIEAHMDSRCDERCNVDCYAPGIDDNGSGTALVIELARAMSKYSFDKTLVFMLTVGEEEGLYGAEAMAKYCVDEDIAIRAVLNNDIVGGIECGNTASPPGCPGEGELDSTHVRLYSNPSILAQHRGLARSIKLYNDEMLQAIMPVPMEVDIQSQEDRTGRGGDHIPFRIQGFTNVRFTSANEHGDASPNPDYSDRQHTSRDVLGKDNNVDGILDEFYVNFEYLKRNAIINGTSMTMLALGPPTPEIEVLDQSSGVRIKIEEDPEHKQYRVGVRSDFLNQNFQELYRTSETDFLVPGLSSGKRVWISVAGMDENNITSVFSREYVVTNDAITPAAKQDDLPYGVNCTLLDLRDVKTKSWNKIKIYPNPSSGELWVKGELNSTPRLSIFNETGQVVYESDLDLKSAPMNEEYFLQLSLKQGIYFYRIENGEFADSHGKLVVTSK